MWDWLGINSTHCFRHGSAFSSFWPTRVWTMFPMIRSAPKKEIPYTSHLTSCTQVLYQKVHKWCPTYWSGIVWNRFTQIGLLGRDKLWKDNPSWEQNIQFVRYPWDIVNANHPLYFSNDIGCGTLQFGFIPLSWTRCSIILVKLFFFFHIAKYGTLVTLWTRCNSLKCNIWSEAYCHAPFQAPYSNFFN